MSTLNTSTPNNYVYKTKALELHVLGGLQLNKLESLRVTLSIEKLTKTKAVLNILRQSIDLYNDNQVEKLVRKCAERLEIGTSVIRKTLQELTKELENYRFLLVDKQHELQKPFSKTLTASEKKEAVKFLKSKKLLEKTNELIGQSGVIGEINNRLLMYLIFTSRKTNNPLHCISLGSSGVGKTHLQSKVAELIPQEDKVEITVLSANAFYYFNRTELQHKLILIEDLDGAENVLYPLRELQSKRRISKTVTLKDNKGNLKTITLRVEGPVCVSGCTTRERIYEDNANRCILLYIDDSAEQDKRIMSYQKALSSAQINHSTEQEIKSKLQNVQRVLRPIKVVNPYAELIDLPDEVFKPRRTLLLLLSFIETITFYHQYQRKVQQNEFGESYIESAKSDVEAAFSLLKEVLFNKSDELSKASRRFLERLKTIVKKGECFSSSQIRKQLRMNASSVKRYLIELQRYGYLKIKGGSRYRGFEYEVQDYTEYEKMRDHIEQKLSTILKKIDQKSGPVVQSSPKVKVDHSSKRVSVS